MATPVIYDTDPGVDDAMALLYLNALPNVSIKGITTICGNASIENCTRNALYLCERFRIDAPVHQGAGASRGNLPQRQYPDFVHGRNGLGDVEVAVTEKKAAPTSAAEAIAEAAARHGDQLVIIAVGRLTNLAAAIDINPEIPRSLKRVIVMGGACKSQGNVSPFAEANIFGDPEAARFVFHQAMPLTLVGLDVTMRTVMDTSYQERMRRTLGDAGRFIHDITRIYHRHHKDSLGWDGFAVHDSSAVAYLDRPELFATERGRLDCVLEGPQRGRTVFAPGQGPHRICARVNSAALLDRYLEVLAPVYGQGAHANSQQGL